MTVTDLLGHQLAEVFRWGLIVALVLTTRNTREVTGIWVPLAAGVLFVAVLIPTAMTPSIAPVMVQIGVGLVANAVILAVVMAGFALWGRLAGR